MNLLPDSHSFPWKQCIYPFNENFYSEMEYNTFHHKKRISLVEGVYTNYTETEISYELNEGFRCKESYDKIDLMSLGCSHTFGLGIPHEHTWGYQLSERLQLNVDNYCNLGLCGASQEQVLIVASSLILRHKPKIVAILAPHNERAMIMKRSKNPEYDPDIICTLNHSSIHDDRILDTLGPLPQQKLEHWYNWISDNDSFITARTKMIKHILEQICLNSNSKLLWVEIDNQLRDQTVFDKDHLHRSRDLLHVDNYHQNMFVEKFMEIYK